MDYSQLSTASGSDILRSLFGDNEDYSGDNVREGFCEKHND